MKLLLTNDDGILAPGIYELAKELEKEHEVLIAAPANQKSACGHSITLSNPIRVKEVKLPGIISKAYSVDGTPADCVRIGVGKLFHGTPDMVVSGINRGLNIGTDILYSGTVSAAIEAAIYKIPSLAASVEIRKDIERYEAAAKYAALVLKMAFEKEIKNDIVLNVNTPAVPQEEIKGIKVCRMGQRIYKHYFIEKTDEQEGINLHIDAELGDEVTEDADTSYIKEKYVTVTPLHYDLTNYRILKEVESWF